MKTHIYFLLLSLLPLLTIEADLPPPIPTPTGSPIKEVALPIDGGVSPDGRIQVVNNHPVYTVSDDNIYPGQDRFEIRSKNGKTLVSEFTLSDLCDIDATGPFVWEPGGVKALWRSDSRFVAIAAASGRLDVATIVFVRDGDKFTRVTLPPQGGQQCLPDKWVNKGDLVLDITSGYTRRGDDLPIRGFYATIRFTGTPPVATKISQTKVTTRTE